VLALALIYFVSRGSEPAATAIVGGLIFAATRSGGPALIFGTTPIRSDGDALTITWASRGRAYGLLAGITSSGA